MQGSVINRIMESAVSPEPAEGMGATECRWSDRVAYTIQAVQTFKTGAKKGQVKEFLMTRDVAVRTDSNGMSESQTYEHTTDDTAEPVRVVRTSRGTWKTEGGSAVAVGHRSTYHDYSF